jgi:small subunit ribosomal protein S1
MRLSVAIGLKPNEILWEDEDSDTEQSKKDASDEFAELLDKEHSRPTHVRVGQQIDGKIISFTSSNDVLVDLPNFQTGVIERNQLLDENGQPKYREGDRITAYVTSTRGGSIGLSLHLSKSKNAANDIRMAWENKLPIKGKVVKENKGGFEVSIFGKHAFCPFSKMTLRFVADKQQFIGNEYEFMVETFEEGGRNIVLSREAMLLQEQQTRLQQLKDGIGRDSIWDGTIVDIKDFGAIVEVGGIEGLIHISEISHSRVARVHDILNRGEKVKVKVLNIEEGDRPRISFSMKQALDDPWLEAGSSFKIGEAYQGRVTKLEKFGAFVELTPGVEGLLPLSEMSWNKRLHHSSDLLSVGQLVSVRVLSFDPTTKRISLSLKDLNADPWFEIEKKFPIGSLHRGKVTHLKDNGAIVEIAEGLSGFIPMGILKEAFGVNYRKNASPPKEIDIQIAKIDKEQRKLLLGISGMQTDTDQEDFREYLESMKEKAATKIDKSKVGGFGELLLQKMNAKK